MLLVSTDHEEIKLREREQAIGLNVSFLLPIFFLIGSKVTVENQEQTLKCLPMLVVWLKLKTARIFRFRCAIFKNTLCLYLDYCSTLDEQQLHSINFQACTQFT